MEVEEKSRRRARRRRGMVSSSAPFFLPLSLPLFAFNVHELGSNFSSSLQAQAVLSSYPQSALVLWYLSVNAVDSQSLVHCFLLSFNTHLPPLLLFPNFENGQSSCHSDHVDQRCRPQPQDIRVRCKGSSVRRSKGELDSASLFSSFSIQS